MRLFSEHLVSNIAAYMALKNLSPTPITLLCQDSGAGELSAAEEEKFPLCEDAETLVFDPMEGFVTPRETVTRELAKGKIVITDRFLHHVDEAMPQAHFSLPVEDLLFKGETQADCVIYITRGGIPTGSSIAAHAHQVLTEMADRRSNVHVVALEDQHLPVCDNVWRQTKICLRPWLLDKSSQSE